MKALIQRCQGEVSIKVENTEGTSIQSFSGVGLVVLLGWLESDTLNPNLDAAEDWIFNRIEGLRIFEDAQGKMNLSLQDYCTQNNIEGGILWVSQFTLAAELESGFRPSFTKAMNPTLAKKRFEDFTYKVKTLSTSHKNIFGEFGATMHLSFTNWGPVTILLEK
ncbi:MAG: D-aminoacyl-tRNA deacylase [Bdellovibrionota bacterium]